jgi:hypothetical protein
MLALANKLSLTTQPVYRFVNKYSIDFDGVDDRIITDGADTVLQPTTYSFWCKSSTTTQNNGVFGHGSDRIGAFHFNRNADRPQLFLGSNYLVIWNDTSAQDDGEWHHWVVYSDPNDLNNCKLYVDGVLQSQSFVDSSGSANAYTESLTIGSERQSGGNSFEGKIDEFAVYDRELTQAEITRMYNNGNPINLNLNASDYQSANPLITSTKSMEFDGVDDYMEVQDDSSLQLEGSEASWTFWTRLDSLSGGDQKFIAKATTVGGANAAYQIRTNNADLLFQSNDGGWYGVTASSFFTDLNWVNVTITLDSSNLASFYKNGVLFSSGNLGIDIPANTGEMLFGARTPSSPTNFLNGEMTEVGIYNRCLTALEVASLYNQGVPTDLLVSRGDYVATGLQGYWKMGDGTNDEYPVIYDQTNPTLGSEEIVNGDFSSSDISMISGAGTRSVVNNELKIEENGAGYSQVIYNGILDTSKIYKATFDFTIGTGSYNIYNTTQGNPQITSSGTYTFYLENTARFYVGSNGAGDVWYMDNISVKEVNGNPAYMTNMVEGNITNQYPLTKIRNYYRMGDGILDGYPIIQDQTSPNLAHIPTTNLATYSENFTTIGWTNDKVIVTTNSVVSPDGTQNASTITPTNVSGVHLISTTGTNTVAMSVYAKQNGYTRFRFNSGSSSNGYASFNLSTGEVAATGGTYLFDSGIEDVGNGWFRCFLVLRGGVATNMTIAIEDASGSVSFTGDGTSGIHLWAAQSEEQLQPTTYIKSDGIAAVRKSSTTNLIPYSEDFNNAAWFKSSAISITSNYATAPDGTQTADRLVSTGGSFPQLHETLTGLTIGQVYTVSFYVKSDGTTQIQQSAHITSNGDTINFTPTNDWVRIQYTRVATATSHVFVTFTNSGSAAASSYLIWGYQVEEQTQAETYAKTTGLPVTIDLFTENNYGTMTNMSASDIVEDTP